MATSRQQYATDTEKLSASMRKDLEMLCPLSSECCIYRIPDAMRRSKHYTPQIVSIGPIHYGKSELRAMEEHKKRYLQDFLQLSHVSLEECFELIQMNETRLRNCYAHVIELNSENFIEIILVDAAFVLMLLLRNVFNLWSLSSSIDRVFQKPTMIRKIRYDMVLLENQLPFFILEDLYKLSNMHNILESNFNLSHLPSHLNFNKETAVIILAYEFIRIWIIIQKSLLHPPSKAEHMLALLRSCLKPADNWNPERKAVTDVDIPSIKELYQAGVKFKVGSMDNMFDIKFQDGVLEIPPLSIGDDTELLFWNLQAYEAYHCLDNLCSDYFIIMHRFTISSADVEFLVENRIIKNRRPNAQRVSAVFHDLLPECHLDRASFGYTDVVDSLNAHYAVPWNRWKATWIQKYFKAPWAFFSFSAALVLLILTIVQTICSILQVI